MKITVAGNKKEYEDIQVEKMGGAHKTAYAEHQPEADEPEQDGAEHEVYQTCRIRFTSD